MDIPLREGNIDIGGAQVFHHLFVQAEAECAQIGFVRPRPQRDFDGTVAQVGDYATACLSLVCTHRGCSVAAFNTAALAAFKSQA